VSAPFNWTLRVIFTRPGIGHLYATKPPNDSTTSADIGRGVPYGCSMVRHVSELYLPAASSVVIVTLLMLGAILVQSSGRAAKDNHLITVSKRNDAPQNIAPDMGISDLRGSLTR
jgi:hypothetical protein